MKFYNQQHKYYCGIDLHARKMFVCVLDQKGKTMVHENINTDTDLFIQIISPYLGDIVVGVECVFCWYWVSDLCAKHQIPSDKNFLFVSWSIFSRLLYVKKIWTTRYRRWMI